MNKDALVASIFQKGSLDDCSLEELQAVARQYPSFTPVQFLIAEKLRTTGGNLYNEQLEKLSLYINNPLWLDFLLNGYETRSMASPENGNVTEQVTEANDNQGNLPSENVSREVSETQQEHPEISSELARPEAEQAWPIEEDDRTQHQIIDTAKQSTIAKESQENVEDEELNANLETSDQTNEVHQSDFPIPLPELKKEENPTEITFEPYHTVDYFASQGIKFIPEEKPKDRFGQQLKSFTDWLKDMKRLPEPEIIRISDTYSDDKVQQLADHSINEGEIVTETMAEVWVKQGNKDKAIEIYNKLSLLNPAKSAYFASLSEQLKNS
jgi:hypothetical protein